MRQRIGGNVARWKRTLKRGAGRDTTEAQRRRAEHTEDASYQARHAECQAQTEAGTEKKPENTQGMAHKIHYDSCPNICTSLT